MRSEYISSRVDSLVSIEPILIDNINKISKYNQDENIKDKIKDKENLKDKKDLKNEVISFDKNKLIQRRNKLSEDKNKLIIEIQDYAFDIFIHI